MRLRLNGALRLMNDENLSTASATGTSLNNGDPAVHPAARHRSQADALELQQIHVRPSHDNETVLDAITTDGGVTNVIVGYTKGINLPAKAYFCTQRQRYLKFGVEVFALRPAGIPNVHTLSRE